MRVDIWDITGVVGIVILAIGFWLIYPPVAFVVVGTLLLMLALYGSRGTSS